MVEALELVPKDKKMFSELRLTACSGCHGLHTMTLTSVLATDGGRNRGKEKIVENLIVDQSTYDRLAQHWHGLLVTIPREMGTTDGLSGQGESRGRQESDRSVDG